MSLSSYLTCNLVARQRQRQRGGVEDEEDEYDYHGPQPQTATCCTALQRGVTADGLLAQPRYAPVRTPGSAAALLLDPPAPMPTTSSGNDDEKKKNIDKLMQVKQVRKCKSTVEEAKVSQLMEGGPRLRRSGGVRRDWSFEDLRSNNAAA
uniref:Uncharacterized protein n=1 Tax=Oryza punctata TaxID=4537 RepID=A0A0E0MDE8_ORYPU